MSQVFLGWPQSSMAGASQATLYAQNVPSTPTHSGNGSMSAPPQEVVLLHKAHPDQSLGLGLSNVEGSTAPVVARVRGVARAAGVRVGDLVVAVNHVQVPKAAPRPPHPIPLITRRHLVRGRWIRRTPPPGSYARRPTPCRSSCCAPACPARARCSGGY